MAETVNSVKFYSLASMPRKYQNGAFLNLTRGDESNPSGLYFCYNNTWKYLVNLNNDIKSAAVFDGVVYFYNVSPAPSSPDGALFSVKLPTLGGGDGISVSNDEINVDLSTTTVSGNTTTPHTGSVNLLKIDSNNKLSLSDTWDCGEYDEQVYRHVKHLKTSNVSYVHVLKADIPDGTVVSLVSSIPSDPTVNSPLYIIVAGLYPFCVVCSPIISLNETDCFGATTKPLNLDNASFTLCFLPPVLSATLVENVAIFCVKLILYSLVVVGTSSI